MGLSSDITDVITDFVTGQWIIDTVFSNDWFNNFISDILNSFGDKSFVGGYEYYAGVHIGVCEAADKIVTLGFAERIAWEGEVVPTTPDASAQIIINKDHFWGGRQPGNGGGLVGIVDVLFGKEDQEPNAYLERFLGVGETPAFRGKLTLVFRGDRISRFDYENPVLRAFLQAIYEARRAKLSEPPTHHTGFYWSARQKQLPNPEVTVIRQHEGWYGDEWQPGLTAIGDYQNGAHILYECLTNMRWGMRKPASIVDTDSTFLAAAQRLYNEGFKLGFDWYGQDSIENFIGTVLYHIDGSLPFNTATGKYELHLARSGSDKYTLDGSHSSLDSEVVVNEGIPIDTPATGSLTIGVNSYSYTSYDLLTKTFTITGTLGSAFPDETEVLVAIVNKELLPHFTSDDIVKDGEGSFTRPLWGEVVNQVALTYENGDTYQEETVTVQDLASVAIQGVTNPTSLKMIGIPNKDLAARVAERELRSGCAPTAKITNRRLTRRASGLVEGMLIRHSHDPNGLDDVIFRVVKATPGDIRDSSVLVDLVEENFNMPTVGYVQTPDTVWENPIGPAADVVTQRYISVPYHALLQNVSNATRLYAKPTTAYPGVIAERPSPQNRSIVVYAGLTASPVGAIEACSGPYCPTAQLRTSIGKFDTTLEYELPNEVDVNLLPGTWFYLDDEKIAVVSVDTSMELSGYWTLTVKRACLDSLPATHTASAKLWFYNSAGGAVYVDSGFVAGDSPYLFTVAEGYTDITSVLDAPVLNPTLDNDWYPPYPPANVLINGEREPTDVLYGFTITWNGRNKISQSTVLVGWEEDHVVPERGTRYTLEVRNGATNALIKTHTDLECGSEGGSFEFYTTNTAPYYKISLWATRDGVSSKVYTYTANDKSGFGYNFGNMMGGMSGGEDLDPGEVLPAESTLYDQTPMASYLNGKWRHFNFDASADASYGVRTIANDESISRSSTDDGATWDLDNIDQAANRPQSAKVVLFANTRYVAIGGKYIWYKTDAASSWTRSDTSGYANNYAGAGNVDSVTHDGSDYVISVNAGKDVYTTPNGSTITRKGTTGSPNDITLLMDVLWIGMIGSNYIASGTDADGAQAIASSTDLETWTLHPAALPMLSNAFDWVYFGGEYYAFGTIGDIVAGRIGCYKTTDAITWTLVNMSAPMHSPMFGHPFITSNGLSVFGGPFIFESADGATWTKTRSTFNPVLAAFARTKMVLGSTESPPDKILLRTGVRNEDFAKDNRYVGNDRKGKLLSFDSFSDTDAVLVYPAGATYDEKIGTLGDFSEGITDAGFGIDMAAVDTAGFRGRNTGKKYFEVSIAEVTELFRTPESIEVGVAIAAGGLETFMVSSAMLDGLGKFYQYARIACPGGVIGSNETPAPTAAVMAAGDVIGVLCDFTAKIIYLRVNNVVVATLEDIPTSLVYWYPVFTGNSTSLLVNLGQSAFTYTQSGYTGWNS